MTKLEQLHDALAAINVLYVEDEEPVRDMTLDFFKNIFTNIDTAADGEEGLRLFKENSYALVISDLKMPKMDGREMLEKIKELDKDVVLMIMTASDSDQDATEIVCDAYMHKPVEFMKFVEVLESYQDKILKR